MRPILELRNISKKYKLRGQESPYLTFRDAMITGFKKRKEKNEFWALQDVSFDVYPGESIGIIGSNGAGKSTLLKILSKITPPTKGHIISRGRIASLLEVGTGFHAELTGRENIFLNGSILGLTKQEITSKFDEIVDFSGVENFLDTPLKHYSSGMQLRLAFAVAAHLEPEILVIDEVLAVGDAEFQKKCLTKMGQVTSEGRTVLFVSHNMGSIQKLCNTGILLEKGIQKKWAEINSIIQLYLSSNKRNTERIYYDNEFGDEFVELKYVKIINKELKNKEYLLVSETIGIKIGYVIKQEGEQPLPNIDLWSSFGEYLLSSICAVKMSFSKGFHEVIVWIPGDLLNNKNYVLGVGLNSYHKNIKHHCYDKESLYFQIHDDTKAKTRTVYMGEIGSLLRPNLNWELNV